MSEEKEPHIEQQEKDIDLSSGEWDLTNVVEIPPFKLLPNKELNKYQRWLFNEYYVTEEMEDELLRKKELRKIELEISNVNKELDRRKSRKR
jgi:hypothetical protein